MLRALRLRPRVSCLERRHPEPQSSRFRFLPCRALSNGLGRNNKNGASGKQRASSPVEKALAKKMSLLEELFPEEAQRRSAPAARPQKELPRLPLDIPDVLQSQPEAEKQGQRKDTELPLDRASYWESMRNTKKQYAQLERQGEFISVLVLNSASKNLSEEDFRRVIPQGKHIEGWSLERGDIIKVVPGRDTSTLERQNFYFILFKSPVSAFSYQTHVTRLHKLAQSQTPSSLSSPIPPPPGYMMGGEDLDSMIQSYSLLSLTQDMNIRQLSPPLAPSVQQIVNHRGYPNLIDRPNKSPFEVLLRLDGPQLAIPHIRIALAKAARDRAMPWTGKETSRIRIMRWDTRGANVSPMSPREIDVEHKDDIGARDRMGSLFGSELPGEIYEGKADRDRERKRRLAAARYILGFDTDIEAQAFVRFWHGRPLELVDTTCYDGDIAPVVNAEVLW